MNRRRFMLGAAGMAGAVLWGTGCTGDGEGGVAAPRRAPVWSFAALDEENLWQDPVVWQGTVIGACDFGGSGGSSVYSLDARTGTMRWRFRCPREVSRPVVVDGMVIVGTGREDATGMWFGIDATTGVERWRLPNVAASSGPPTVVDGVVHVNSIVRGHASALRAFGAADGRLRWSTETAFVGANITAAGGVVYTVTGAVDDRATGLDAKTGRQLWVADPEVESYGHVALSADARTVYAMGADGGAVVAYELSTGHRRWASPVRTIGADAFVVADGTVYVPTTSGVTALDGESGAARWTARTPHSPGVAAPVVAHGMVFVATGDVGEADDDGDVRKPFGDIHAFDAATGIQRWVFDAGTNGSESLCAGPDAVYAEHRGSQMSCFDPHTGAVRWKVELPNDGFLLGQRVYTDGTLYGTGDKLHAIPA